MYTSINAKGGRCGDDHINKWNILTMIIGTVKKNLVAGVVMMTIMMNRRKILVTINYRDEDEQQEYIFDHQLGQ